MSNSETSYDANYSGYQDWYTAQNKQYESVLNDTELAQSNPMMWIMELLGVIMGTYNGYIGWSGLEINHTADLTTTISNLQAAFSSAQYYDGTPTDQQMQAVGAADDQYNKSNAVVQSGDTNNPFYDVDQTIVSQFTAIFPPGWTFPETTGDSGKATSAQTNSVMSYWHTAWQNSAQGDTSLVNSIQTAFNNALSATSGASSEFQSENKYYASQLQQIEGLFQNTTKSVTGVESQSVQNEISA